MKTKKPCINSSLARKAHGKKPYHAPTQKTNPILAARNLRLKQRGLSA